MRLPRSQVLRTTPCSSGRVRRDRVAVVERPGPRRRSRPGRRRRSRRRCPPRSRPCRAARPGRAGAAIQRTTSSQRVAAPRRLGPHRRQAELQRGDAAPRRAKSPTSPFSSAVHGEWSETTQSISPSARPPERLAVGRLADRRAALELRRARRGSSSAVKSGSAGRSRRRSAAVARAAAISAARRRRRGAARACARRSPGRLDQLGDRLVLRVARAGRQEVGVAPAPRRGRARWPRRPRRARSAARRGRPARRAYSPAPSASTAGTRPRPSRQEALEAEDAGLVQPAQLGEVAGDDAAPEPDVDMTLPRRPRLVSSASTRRSAGSS